MDLLILDNLVNGKFSTIAFFHTSDDGQFNINPLHDTFIFIIFTERQYEAKCVYLSKHHGKAIIVLLVV